jgi:hypothetical protein
MLELFTGISCLAFFAAFWAGVCLVVAFAGGWTDLAKTYRDHGSLADKPLKSLYLQTGAVGEMGGYRSCLTLRICESGLRMSVFPLFRPGHPALFIPWEEFHSGKEIRGLFGSYWRVSVGRPVIAEILLPLRVCDYLPRGIASELRQSGELA